MRRAVSKVKTITSAYATKSIVECRTITAVPIGRNLETRMVCRFATYNFKILNYEIIYITFILVPYSIVLGSEANECWDSLQVFRTLRSDSIKNYLDSTNSISAAVKISSIWNNCENKFTMWMEDPSWLNLRGKWKRLKYSPDSTKCFISKKILNSIIHLRWMLKLIGCI